MINTLPKKHNTVTPRDLYIHYASNQDVTQMTLSYDKWKAVIFDVMACISKAMIQNGLVVTASCSLGMFGVERSRNDSKRKVDFHLTKKLGKTVFYSNLHTDGSSFRFSWRKRSAQMRSNKNMSIYKWTPIRGEGTDIGVRGLAKWIKYCSVDPFIKDYDAPYRFL